MTLAGIVRNGVVVFDAPQQLPEGTRVEVVVQLPGSSTLHARLAELAGTVDDLPPDMARNHDHYIHGAPQK